MTGAFVKGLEEAADVKAEVVGKPTGSFFKTTLASLEKDGVSESDWDNVGLVRYSRLLSPAAARSDFFSN